MTKAKAAIIGSGNIGMDLMYKVLKNSHLEMSLLAGLSNDSPRLARARAMGIPTSDRGIEAIVENPDCCDIVFDATTAKAHAEHAKVLKKLGKKAIDLTPAGVGAWVVPAFNLEENLDRDNINLISCGGQAVIPIIGAIQKVVPVEYAEAVAANSSKSVGPGTRANIDEYTQHTREGMMKVGGVKSAKAVIVINPADPPIVMHNTIFCVTEKLDEELAREITASIEDMLTIIQSYVPGYRLTAPPQFAFDRRQVTTMIEVEGAGDYLPDYAGNLDIITQAAVHVAAEMAKRA
ncbi:MAG: acetaldehyde dehydrogenase (acetylating) [Candidatus Adiutrix sp.]|jgi:acetaldehyde dehydrogenase|nr:acetaldehyde dehydrogenase (acetylating) [Candidatus Adiutrix sp.]